jgi:hypothetical protein
MVFSVMVHRFCMTPETLSSKGTPNRGPGYVTRPDVPAGSAPNAMNASSTAPPADFRKSPTAAA